MYLPEGVSHHPEADSFDLRGSLARVGDACRAYRRAFYATVLLTLSLAGLYLWLFPPIYVAEVLLVGDSEKDLARDNFYQLWNVFRREHLPNEPELIRANSVLAEVVRDLDLGYDDVYHPFVSHASHLWQVSPVGRSYRSVKLFFFPPKPSPWQPTDAQLAMGMLLTDFQSGTELKPVPESTVARLTVRGPSERVAQIANKLADVYLDGRRQRFIVEATRAYEALTVEVQKARDELTDLEVKRQKYAEENGLLLDFEKEKLDVSTSTELQNKIYEIEADIKAFERKEQAATEQLKNEAAEKTSLRVFDQNMIRERLRNARLDLQVSLDGLRLRYRADSPEVQELEKRIATLDTQIAGESEKTEKSNSSTLNSLHEELHRVAIITATELQGMRVGLDARKRTLTGMRAEVLRIPEKVKSMSSLFRDLKSQEQRYQALADRAMMAKVSIAAASAAPPSMRVVDYASPPSDPVWPRKKFFVPVAVLLALLAGTLVAVLLDLLEGRVTRARLAQTRTGLLVYGTVEFGGARAVELLPAEAVAAARVPDRRGESVDR